MQYERAATGAPSTFQSEPLSDLADGLAADPVMPCTQVHSTPAATMFAAPGAGQFRLGVWGCGGAGVWARIYSS